MSNKGSGFTVQGNKGSAFRVQRFRVKKVRTTWADMICILMMCANIIPIKTRAGKTMDQKHSS
jgi:hypothetical protein